MRGKSKGDTTAERVVSVYSHIDCRTHHTTRERDHVEEGRRLVLVPPIGRTTPASRRPHPQRTLHKDRKGGDLFFFLPTSQ